MPEQLDHLTLKDSDGDTLKLLPVYAGVLHARVAHDGMPTGTIVALSIEDQRRLVDYVSANLAAAEADTADPCQVCGGPVQWHPESDDFGDCSECGSTQDHPDLLAGR